MAESATVQCPECQARMRLKQTPVSGAKLKCPKCQAAFRYEGDDEEDYDEIDEAPKRKVNKYSSSGKKKTKSSSNLLPILIGGIGGAGGVALIIVLAMTFLVDSISKIHQETLQTINDAKATLDKVTTAAEADAAATKIDQASARLNSLAERVSKLAAGKPEQERQIVSTNTPTILQAVEAQKASWRTLREGNRSSVLLDGAQSKFLMVQVGWMQAIMKRTMPGAAGMPGPPAGMMAPAQQ